MSLNLAGYKLKFVKDKKPFPAQLSVMSKSLNALKNSQSALLESPTGTGKTLALLTSTLCWQKAHFEEQIEEYELLKKEFNQVVKENERIQMEYFKEKVDKAKEEFSKEVAISSTVIENKGEKTESETDIETEQEMSTTCKKRKGKAETKSNPNVVKSDMRRITRSSQSSASQTEEDERKREERNEEENIDGTGFKKIKMTTTSNETQDSVQPNGNGSWSVWTATEKFISAAINGISNGNGSSTGMTPTQIQVSNTTSSQMDLDEEVNDDIEDCDADNNDDALGMMNKQPEKQAPGDKNEHKANNSVTPTTTTTTTITTTTTTNDDKGPTLFPVPPEPVQPKRATIFFCSRTHSQLKQVVEELKQVDGEYLDVCNSCILGSRQQLCVNPSVRDEAVTQNIALNECCNKAVTNRNCRYTNNQNMDSLISELHGLQVWDIEEATHEGKVKRGCPYMAVRSILSDTSPNLVLCPYNYILDKSIRESMKLDLEGAVIVFDEAHNLEDTCRSAASATLQAPALERSWLRLNILQASSQPIVKDLRNLVGKIKEWMVNMNEVLDYDAIKRLENVWKGQEILEICHEKFGLNVDTVDVFSTYLKEFRQAEDVFGKLAYEPETTEDGEKEKVLDGATLQLLNSLFQAFAFMKDPDNLDAYRMILTSQWKNYGPGRNIKEIALIFSCMNAGVAYRDATEGVRSVLLTSGTLSPLQSFAGEFGVSFPVTVEAKHSIDLTRQIFVRVIESSDNVLLKGVYQNQKSTQWQDAIGSAVLNASAVTPGGLLVFVSSYGLLATLKDRFESTSGYEGDSYFDRIRANHTRVFVEPKNSKELEILLKEYYKIIDDGGKAILFAVCRGKVSEGIDFANNYARTVMLVGIPFPSFGDIEVTLKRQYQDQQNRMDPNQVNGGKWYEVQAFRALNQAMGRCIRHKNDYGAILLCDVRFKDQRNKNNMSRWMRDLIMNGGAMQDVVLPLKLFFQQVATEFPYTKPVIAIPPTLQRVIGLQNNSKNKIKSEVKNKSQAAKNDHVKSDTGIVDQSENDSDINQRGKKKGVKSTTGISNNSNSSRSGNANSKKKNGTTQLTLI